ncbi:MAG TPA: hypothetical protein ENI87_03505 [bacterium]|nr:hypothetical protein [bacterium]
MTTLPLRSLSFALLLPAATATAQVNWQLLATGNPPGTNGGAAWDSVRNVLVTYGGESNGIALGATREWNGTTWTTMNPANPPVPVGRPAMAYDAARQVVVMFGGVNGGTFLNQTLTWDGTDWTAMSPATLPSSRAGAAMAYDAARQVVVMFGGFGPGQADRGDTWEWDGSDWTLRANTGPSPRGAHRMVYDSANGYVVLAGGYRTANQATVADTWTWNGSSWTQRASLPTTLCDQALAYDPTRQVVMLFGGLNIANGVLTDLGDTLEFDGTWTQRTPTTVGPTPRNGTAAAFDPVNNRMLVAGGSSTFSGFLQTWSYGPVQPATASEFGIGCFVTAGVRTVPKNLPYTSRPFHQEIVDASPAAAIGLMVFGVSDTLWNGVPLPLDLTSIGAPTCSLLVSLDVALTVNLTGGAGTLTWNLPNTPSAAGAQFFTQGVVLDPTSPLSFPIDLTPAWRFTIGNP